MTAARARVPTIAGPSFAGKNHARMFRERTGRMLPYGRVRRSDGSLRFSSRALGSGSNRALGGALGAIAR